MFDGKRQQIDIRQLPGAQQTLAVHGGIIQQTDIVSDKLVMTRGYCRQQTES